MFVDACNVIQERKVERKPTRILPWGGGGKTTKRFTHGLYLDVGGIDVFKRQKS